jgi:hypothetical protein
MVEVHFAADVATEATGERPQAMRSLAFLHQVSYSGIVQHCGSTGRLYWHTMTVGTGTCACRSEHELTMRIVQDPDGDRRQCTAMLGVTAEA